MQFVAIEYRSPWYDAELALREEILRQPLGLSLADEDLSAEANQWHFGLVDGERLVACLILVPRAANSGQLRQMAVDSRWQNRGLGRQLVEQVEQVAADRGITHLMLHARSEAIGFYERLGYQIEGEPYIEVGIAHQTMSKRLGPSPPRSISRARDSS
jgi:GNAT superfamily N-acetyltransferase